MEVVTSPAGASHLKIAAADASFRHSLRVPAGADTASIRASVQHGLLRVRIPKLVPKTQEIPVAAAAPQPAADKAPEEEGGAKPEAEPEVVSVQMAVPGLSSDEVRPRFRPLSAAPSRSTSRPSSRLATSRAPKLLL